MIHQRQVWRRTNYPGIQVFNLLPAAEQMSKWAAEFEHTAQIDETKISGMVTIAAPPGIAVEQLAPFAALLKKQEPAITLAILSAVDYVDLTRGVADIAIRTRAPSEPELIALDQSMLEQVVMASSQYAQHITQPCKVQDLN